MTANEAVSNSLLYGTYACCALVVVMGVMIRRVIARLDADARQRKVDEIEARWPEYEIQEEP